MGNAVKEHTVKSVECTVNSSNPASLVDIEFLIDDAKQDNITPKITETPGSNSGIVKTYAYMFTAERTQNGEMAKCYLRWNGMFIEEMVAPLNITCK